MNKLHTPLYSLLAVAAALALGGCVSVPTGPQVSVMPGPGKSYEQFRSEAATCEQYAQQSIGGAAAATQNNVVNNAAVGTAVGAVAGAVVGAMVGQAGHGAAIGAGGGLLVGSANGANAAAGGNYSMQQRYDNTYSQCMYAKGNQVQSAGGRRIARYYSAPPPPPPPGYYGPPPTYYGPPPGAY